MLLPCSLPNPNGPACNDETLSFTQMSMVAVNCTWKAVIITYSVPLFSTVIRSCQVSGLGGRTAHFLYMVIQPLCLRYQSFRKFRRCAVTSHTSIRGPSINLDRTVSSSQDSFTFLHVCLYSAQICLAWACCSLSNSSGSRNPHKMMFSHPLML